MLFILIADYKNIKFYPRNIFLKLNDYFGLFTLNYMLKLFNSIIFIYHLNLYFFYISKFNNNFYTEVVP